MSGVEAGAELPALVRGYLERVLPAGGAVPREVRIAQVGWELPEGSFTYWRGTITSVELSPESAEGYAAVSA